MKTQNEYFKNIGKDIRYAIKFELEKHEDKFLITRENSDGGKNVEAIFPFTPDYKDSAELIAFNYLRELQRIAYKMTRTIKEVTE